VVGWPFGYHELLPYYLDMERRFEVCGTADPLRPGARYELLDPPAMSETDRHFFECMQAAGLHPHRLHNAVRYGRDGAEQKLDARTQLLMPAAATGRLSIQSGAEVDRVSIDADEADGVVARVDGVERLYRARAVILAAGALTTPVLLHRSANGHWPQGLGNHSGMVGRNLMFHASDFVAVWPRGRRDRQGPSRAIALRDFYRVGGLALGEFQSMGLTAGYGEILTYLHQRFDSSPFRRIPLLRHLLRIPAWMGARLFDEATVFTTIIEDFPYLENRIELDGEEPAGFRVHYTISGELRERVHRMRSELRSALQSLRVLVVNPEVSLNFGHGCGTCRAGEDPQSSVVDRHCRIHGTRNVYVADGSFMPTSGGANPSLTIAANAARVADLLAAELRTGRV
jgi:choline dehydrogenase-like flavoprotein